MHLLALVAASLPVCLGCVRHKGRAAQWQSRPTRLLWAQCLGSDIN